MLLASGSVAGHEPMKSFFDLSSRPKMQIAVAPTQKLSGALEVPALNDISLIQLHHHDQAKPTFDKIMDHGHRALEQFRSNLEAHHQREEDEGINLMRHIYELKQKKLGTDDPGTLTALFNYADVLCSAGRHAEAEPLKKQLLNARRRELGEEHLDTLRSMSTYAETLMALHREAEAETMQRRALEMLRRSLGPEHADTIKASNIYDKMLAKMSRHVVAEPRNAEKRYAGMFKRLNLSPEEVKAASQFQRIMAMA